MKFSAVFLALFVASGLSLLRADLPVQVRSTGFGVVVLAEPLPRAALEELLSEARTGPDGGTSSLWLRWADGEETALDMEVARLLPDGLLKVYTMSSTSPMLSPGERSGAASVVALPKAPYLSSDWALKPGETEEKAELVAALHARYGSAKKAEDLVYYHQAKRITQLAATAAEKRAARDTARENPAPALRATNQASAKATILPLTLLQSGRGPDEVSLKAKPKDFVALPRSVQVPLGNYNYDLATIDALNRPNELTVAEARGLDLFALAQRQFGAEAVAAVELFCYNGFTSTITAPGQGLLLAPADGDYAAALAAGELIYASFEVPEIVAVREPGQSPAESASGVLAINVLLR